MFDIKMKNKNYSIIHNFLRNAAVILTFLGHTKIYIHCVYRYFIAKRQNNCLVVRVTICRCNMYKPFGAAGVSIFFHNFNSMSQTTADFTPKFLFQLFDGARITVRIRFLQFFFLVLKMYEETNVTPYFYV